LVELAVLTDEKFNVFSLHKQVANQLLQPGFFCPEIIQLPVSKETHCVDIQHGTISIQSQSGTGFPQMPSYMAARLLLATKSV
jgi:hypothetical protein